MPGVSFFSSCEQHSGREEKGLLPDDRLSSVMQIPEDTLKILTVEGLAWSNMFWGLNGMYKGYGGFETTEIDGVDIMTDLNNGWVRLQEEIEGAAYLLKIWQDMDEPEIQYFIDLISKAASSVL